MRRTHFHYTGRKAEFFGTIGKTVCGRKMTERTVSVELAGNMPDVDKSLCKVCYDVAFGKVDREIRASGRYGWSRDGA